MFHRLVLRQRREPDASARPLRALILVVVPLPVLLIVAQQRRLVPELGGVPRHAPRVRVAVAVPADAALADVVREARLVDAEEQPEAHHEAVGREVVLLAADHEAPRGEVLAGRRALRDLLRVHPVGARDHLDVPRRAPAHAAQPGLRERQRRYWLRRVVLDDVRRGAVRVGVQVDVALALPAYPRR